MQQATKVIQQKMTPSESSAYEVAFNNGFDDQL